MASPPKAIFLSYGFRPFFLAAAFWAIVDVAIWLSLYEHGGSLPSRFDPLTWHIHEMLFGFVMAAVSGFLLTAVANWTGRPPISGWPLAILAIAWLVGRLACIISAWLPAPLAVLLDLALPMILIPVITREIIASRNWRNLMMVAPVVVLALANLLMHLESLGVSIPTGLGWRLGIAAVLVLLSAVGGRIIPAFTRNWLLKQGLAAPGSRGLIDRVALGTLHTSLFAWALFPDSIVSAVLLLAASVLNAIRWLRWQGAKTRKEPLLLILHIGYGWLILGAALLGLSAGGFDVQLSAALHSLTVGAIATMILAVMTRATRGHTGRLLVADRRTQLIFVLISVAAIARVIAAFGIWENSFLILSAAAWGVAFACFLVVYGQMLVRPRIASA